MILKAGLHNSMALIIPLSFFSDHREGSSSEESPLFQMVGDGDSTEDITLPLVFLFSREGAVLTAALEEHHNVDVLLLPKERQLGRGEDLGGGYKNIRGGILSVSFIVN